MYNVVSSYFFHRLFVSNFCAISYVQDTESSLYYLQSRYYEPEMGRFINADVLISTGQGILGNNMFAYCRNNSVSRTDASGQADISAVEESFDDDVEVGPNDKELGGGGGSDNGGVGSGGEAVDIVLFRVGCPAEVDTAIQSQQFDTCETGYTFGKFFATIYEHAVQWGNTMYPDGNYKVMQATFDSQILGAPGTQYYSSLDSIGPAYFLEIGDLNHYVKCIQ